jgi:hypothetical protein
MDEKPQKVLKSKNVSPNVRVASIDDKGNATLVDLRKLSKDERKQYRDCPRYCDILEVAEKRQQEVEQAAAAATAKTSPSEQTEPTTAKPAEQPQAAASEK